MTEPLSFWVASGVIAPAGIPLALKLVPPNRWYGFRTARTLPNRELWFRVNRFAGCALLIALSVSASVYVAAPGLASGRSFLGLLVFAVPLVSALVVVMAYMRKPRAPNT
jgi:uncharacterized membrane protein